MAPLIFNTTGGRFVPIYFYHPQMKLRRLCFYRCLSVHIGEACVVAPGKACVVAPGGHAWLLQGVCMVAPEGCAWLLPGGHALLLWGACMAAPGGMYGCSQGGVHGIQRHTEIRSMSGQYTSYWNAFLSSLNSLNH